MVGSKKWWNFPDLSLKMFPQKCTWKNVCSYTLTQNWSFSMHAWVYVHLCTLLWSSKVWNFPVCLSTSNRPVKNYIYLSASLGNAALKIKGLGRLWPYKKMLVQCLHLYRWVWSVCRTLRLDHRKLHSILKVHGCQRNWGNLLEVTGRRKWSQWLVPRPSLAPNIPPAKTYFWFIMYDM